LFAPLRRSRGHPLPARLSPPGRRCLHFCPSRNIRGRPLGTDGQSPAELFAVTGKAHVPRRHDPAECGCSASSVPEAALRFRRSMRGPAARSDPNFTRRMLGVDVAACKLSAGSDGAEPGSEPYRDRLPRGWTARRLGRQLAASRKSDFCAGLLAFEHVLKASMTALAKHWFCMGEQHARHVRPPRIEPGTIRSLQSFTVGCFPD
jgi:hypothetical protein